MRYLDILLKAAFRNDAAGNFSLDQSTTGGGGKGRRSEVGKGASGGGEGEVQFTGVNEASTE
jgi:hypothetical protein